MEPQTTTRGRRYERESDLALSDPFLDDFTRILQSKGLRRLADKTQTVFKPESPHMRTRLIHTNEVIAISTAIADGLGLNSSLVQAIAAGHDIGHTPYGHTGERLLSRLGGKPFHHGVFGVVLAQYVERKGRGLNLCYETLEGILKHSGGSKRLDGSWPQEYVAVSWGDRIAYTFADVNDAIRYGVVDKHALPSAVTELGSDQWDRTKTVVDALVNQSREAGRVLLDSGPVFERLRATEAYLANGIYARMNAGCCEEHFVAIYEYFAELLSDRVHPVVAVALLTDGEVRGLGTLLRTGARPTFEELRRREISTIEILDHMKTDPRKIDYTNPDLSWGARAD